jgi:hypothetical protein
MRRYAFTCAKNAATRRAGTAGRKFIRLIPVPPETDREQNNETCGRRVSRERMLLRKELDSVVQKTSKKVKKSLSGFGKFNKRGKVG